MAIKRAIALAVILFSGAATLAAPPEKNETDKALEKISLFTKDDAWHKDVSKEPVDPNSAALVETIGVTKGLHPDFGTQYGIPFMVVDGSKTPKVKPKFEYADESDAGPYPVPDKPLIEGVDSPESTKDGDRHILVIDKETSKLYELYHCFRKDGNWNCGSGAIFDLKKASVGQRPKGWTSADAAGLPIFPGLVRFDEVVIKKEIDHAIRFTCVKTRKAFVSPASHHAGRGNDANLPPMGMRVRLKADFDISGYPEDCQVILKCLKKYGMILADNGSDWFISGAPDSRWNDETIDKLKKVKGSSFEVVKMGTLEK